MSRWYLEPILNSYAAAIGLTALLALLLLIGPQYGRLTRVRRGVLIGLRATLIAMVLLAMLRPSLISTRSEPQSASLLFIYDQSRSLDVADASDGNTRWETLRETLTSAAGKIEELGEIFELKAYSFAEKVTPREITNGKIEIPDAPSGDQTDIGSSLDEVVRREAGKRVVGVVLMSDGAQRAHQPSVDLQKTARELARLGYPLYTVTFGRPRDQSQSRDVWVQNLQDQYSVFVKNELIVRGTVSIQGYVNSAIPVRMQIESPDGQKRIVSTVSLTASEDSQQQPFEFSYVPDQVGQHKMTIIADKQPGEIVTDNNELAAYINVLDGGLRVLMLNGNLLGAEQQLIRHAIGSSPDIDLVEKRADMRRRNQVLDLSEEFKQPFDVFLLSDLHAKFLGQQNALAIAKAVENGKGLLMTGGFFSFGPGGYGEKDHPLRNVLPVRFGRFENQEFGPTARVPKDLHFDGPLSMVPSRAHFITRLGPNEENEQLWERLPAMSGANKLQVKDRALVLARSQPGDPLLIQSQFGAGRVLAFAADSTHLWSRRGFQQEHKRFWRQMMLWLSGKDLAENQEVWIQLDRRRFNPGEPIAFTTGARDAAGDPLRDGNLRAELKFPNGQRQPIRLDSEGDQWSGFWDEVLEPGEFSIEVSAEIDGKTVTNSGRFVVMQRDLELSDPAANPEQMKLLASITKKVGGRAVSPEKFGGLLDAIKEAPPSMNVRVESKWQLGDTKRDAWVFFILVVVLMSTEWYLRKKWGLV